MTSVPQKKWKLKSHYDDSNPEARISEDEIIDAVHERYIGKPSLSAEGEKEYKVDDNDNFIFKKVYQTRINKANNLNAPKN